MDQSRGILGLITLGHVAVTTLYALYPLSFDRRDKAQRVRLVLWLNLALGSLALVCLAYFGLPPWRFESLLRDTNDYLWAVAGGIFLAHGLFVEAPAVFVAKRYDRRTSKLLEQLCRLLGGVLYGSDWRSSVLELQEVVADNKEVLQAYGLLALAEQVAQVSGAQPRRDPALFLLQLVTDVQRALVMSDRFPFKDINSVLSATGLGALIGLALSVLVQGT